MALVTPDIIEDLALDVLVRRHPEHLAALERDRGLPAQTVEPLATVEHLIGEGVRLRTDKPPVALLGVFGTARTPERDKHGLNFTWTMAVQVVTVGTDRADTIRRRSWYAMTVAECLVARLPRRAQPIDSVVLVDVDFTNGTTTDQRPRTVGEAQLLFEVVARQTMDPLVLPPDDSTWQPGTPGGPPATPYEPPVGFPPAADVTTRTDREPL